MVAANPRTTFLPAESAALRPILRAAAPRCFLFDLGFVLEPGLARLMADLGVRPEQQVVDRSVEPLHDRSRDGRGRRLRSASGHALGCR